MTSEVIKNLIPLTTITTANTQAVVGYSGEIPDWVKGITLDAEVTYGSGGTSMTAYVQTSFDNVNWIDIACFAFTTASLRKGCNLSAGTPVTTFATLTDGAMTSNTSLDGIIGKYIRTKFASVGTYAGSTTIALTAKFQR